MTKFDDNDINKKNLAKFKLGWLAFMLIFGGLTVFGIAQVLRFFGVI